MERAHRFRLGLFALTTLVLMALIFFFSSQSALHSQRLSDGFLQSLAGQLLNRFLPRLSGRGMAFDIRKYAHMAEFFCLGVSAFLLFSEAFRWRPDLRAALSALLFSLLYAGTDEVHQLFVPGRAGRFSDVLVDGVGILAGIALSRLLQWALGPKKRGSGPV